jgi:two-component system, LytTR family, sensor kinase
MKRKNKIIIHLFFWFYMVNQLLFPFYISKMETYYYYDSAVGLVLNVINFYIVYFSIPFFLKKRNLILTILAGIGILAAVSVFRYYIYFLLYRYFIHLPPKEPLDLSILLYNNIRLTIINGIYAVLIRLAIDWFETQRLKSDLIQQKQASELALLRSQVNPHFLFNTLNNIYSLVYMRSEDAPAAVMKLSSIMRYMLYDANTDKVLLEKEVEYLKSFIELQKLRLKQASFIDMQVTGELNGRTIAPMLLIPFVENAFKHSSKTAPGPGIRITLDVQPARVTFMVANLRRKTPVDPGETTGGIGMTNIKRRLELLYPGRHSLSVNQDEETYTVNLTLED